MENKEIKQKCGSAEELECGSVEVRKCERTGVRKSRSGEMQKDRKAEGQKGKSKKAIGFLLCCLIALFLYYSTTLFAQEKKDEREPTIITSEILTADNKAKTALFERSVIAKKGDMTLFADKMMVYYSEEKGDSNIKKIDAEGNVKLIKGERVVTSKNATYLTIPEERIIFTGEPRAIEGENVVTGTKMIYYMKDDRSVVENSKVFLMERKSGSAEAQKTKKSP